MAPQPDTTQPHPDPVRVDPEVERRLVTVRHWREQVNFAQMELNAALIEARTAGAHIDMLEDASALDGARIRRVVGEG